MSPAKSIRRIAVLGEGPQGDTSPTVVFSKKKRKKKKQTAGFATVERVVRRVAEANNDFETEYLRRHKRSNRKKRDGWMRDWGINVFKATRKGSKRLRLDRLVRL